MPTRSPAAVRHAIQTYEPPPGFILKPPGPNETSIIFDWGVRVEWKQDDKSFLGWICLADDACRHSPDGIYLLSVGKTSKATRHLRIVHDVVSDKTSSEIANKRKREGQIQALLASSIYKNNPQRLSVLLETVNIVFNNLPLHSVESIEARLIEGLRVRDEMKVVLNAEVVSNAIVELYASTRREIESTIEDARMPGFGNFVLMADFWTCKTTSNKFLGVRVYFVDQEWQLKSVLLGTRLFRPAFQDRDGGIQKPFRAWLQLLLEDFGLKESDFVAGISDGGSDVKSMMTTNLKLRWEWCMAHMAHAATKAACGMVDNISNSKNPELTMLIAQAKKTIYQVKHVEKAGDLFEKLCQRMTKDGSSRLLDYSSSRFLSITSSIKRVLDKWAPLEVWYTERKRQAERQRSVPPVFLLKDDRQNLEHVLSVLLPIARVKALCQSVKPNQVEVLLSLFIARLHTLNSEKPLLHYASDKSDPQWIQPNELTPIAAKTRRLLRDAFDQRFFSRYTNPVDTRKTPFVFEMQQRLHPSFKRPESSLNRVVRLVCSQMGLPMSESNRRVAHVNEIIDGKLRDLLRSIMLRAEDVTHVEYIAPVQEQHSGISQELYDEFASRMQPQSSYNRVLNSIDEELERWMGDPVQLARYESTKEGILQFWNRMERTGAYHILPKAARVLYAIPSSSAQIERDFSVSGMLVQAQRTRLKAEKVDMCAFLNRNRDYVDLTQCEEIPKEKQAESIPKSTLVPIESIQDLLEEETFTTWFSSASIDDGQV